MELNYLNIIKTHLFNNLRSALENVFFFLHNVFMTLVLQEDLNGIKLHKDYQNSFV